MIRQLLVFLKEISKKQQNLFYSNNYQFLHISIKAVNTMLTILYLSFPRVFQSQYSFKWVETSLFQVLCNQSNPADYNQQMFRFFGCGGGSQSMKGRNSFEIYDKVAKQDKQLFTLNAQKGVKCDGALIERMANHNPKSVLNAPKNQQQYLRFIRGNFSQFIKREILKSQYDQLLIKYKNSNELWTDSDFPPNQKSWGNLRQPVIWKRINEIIPNAKFVTDNFSSSDILQGKTGDCYFLSAVAGLAQKPYRIKKIFPNYDMNKNGFYMARILHRGVYQQVVVDDYVPCTPKGQLYGAQPAGGDQIWVMILQKCWAKLYGSYQAIQGGLPHQVLRAFSSAPTYNYRITKDKEQQQALWGKMLFAEQNQYIICCGTANQSKSVNLQTVGLVGGHAYTVLGVYQRPYRLVKLRNPWGNLEWKGAASQNDKKFWSKITPQDQLKMGFNEGDDGTFFMLWQDFQKYFVVLDICRINDNAHYYYAQNTFDKNKPILYNIFTEGGNVTLAASQKSKRELKKQNKALDLRLANTTLILARVNDQGNGFQYIQSKANQNYSQHYLTCSLQKGRYILCCYVQSLEGSVQSAISVYTQSNTSILESQANRDDFLHLVYLDHARKNDTGKQILNPNPLEWVVFDILTDSCGFGYTAFHLDAKSVRKLGLEFDEAQYQMNGLELLPPFKGAGKFKLVCEIGHELIILCRLKLGKFLEQFTMPTPKMYRLK